MIDFDYYKVIFMGDKIDDEVKFKRYLKRAKRTLDLYTFNRINNVEDKEILELVRVCLCELIENEAHFDELKSIGDIKSMTQGKRAVTYYTPDELGLKSYGDKQYSIIYENLAYTRLIDIKRARCFR